MSKERRESLDWYFLRGMAVIVVALLGWLGKQHYADGKKNSDDIAEQSLINAEQTETLKTLTKRLEQHNSLIGQQARDIQDARERLILREANSFTAKDANKLSIAITELSTQFVGQKDDMKEMKADLKELTKLVKERM